MGSRQPQRRLIVLAIALAVAATGIKVQDPLLGVIGFLAVLVSTAELFLPLRYRLDRETARVRCGFSVTEVAWSDVRRLIPMAEGVRLSPLEKPSRLDDFRGVYLRYGDRALEVSGKIRQFWHGDTSALDGGPDGTGGGRPGGEAGGPNPSQEA